jgi:hypothetical protein
VYERKKSWYSPLRMGHQTVPSLC